jgi:hypothetical protein
MIFFAGVLTGAVGTFVVLVLVPVPPPREEPVAPDAWRKSPPSRKYLQ